MVTKVKKAGNIRQIQKPRKLIEYFNELLNTEGSHVKPFVRILSKRSFLTDYLV